MQVRAHVTSENEGFKKGTSSKYETPMYIKNGGSLIKGVSNEDLLHFVTGLAGTAGLAYGGKKLYDHLKNKDKQ